MDGPQRERVGPEVAPVMVTPPLTSVRAEPEAKMPTDLDRYVRREFGDRSATWLIARLAQTDAEAEGESTQDDRLFRRAARAIAALF